MKQITTLTVNILNQYSSFNINMVMKVWLHIWFTVQYLTHLTSKKMKEWKERSESCGEKFQSCF